MLREARGENKSSPVILSTHQVKGRMGRQARAGRGSEEGAGRGSEEEAVSGPVSVVEASGSSSEGDSTDPSEGT